MPNERPARVRIQTDPPRPADSGDWDTILEGLRAETGALSPSARALVEAQMIRAENDLKSLRKRVESDTELSNEQRSEILGSVKSALTLNSRVRKNGLGAMAVGEGTALSVENARAAQAKVEELMAGHMPHTVVRTGDSKAPKGKTEFSTDDTKGAVREVFAQSPSLDVLSTDAPPPITMKRPGGKTSTVQSDRDKARQSRPKGSNVSGPAAQSDAPTRLSGDERRRLAETQADIDNGALVKGVPSGVDERLVQAPDVTEPAVEDPESGPHSRDLEFESKIQQEYYAKETANELPLNASGAPMGFVEYMENAYLNKADSASIEAEKDEPALASDATQAETSVSLADGIKKIEVLARLNQQKEQREGSEGKFLAANPELRERAGAAKEAYFTALRAYQRSRSLKDAGAERLGFKKTKENEGPANLQALKRGWLEARMEVAKARLEAVVREREARGALDPEHRGPVGKGRLNMRERDTDAVLARFQRRYVIRDAVMGATAEETKMRAEALSSRDRNLIEWTFKAYDALPEGVKDFVTQVGLGVGVVGVSAGAAGLVAAGGIGAAAFAPILFATGLGLKWRADALGLKKKADRGEAAGRPSEEVQRLRAAQQSLQKKAQFTTFSGVMGWLTGKVTKGLQEETRTKAEADISRRDEAGNIGSVGVGDLRNADQFEALAKSLERAYASVKQADAQLVTATTVGSVVGGIAVGAGYGAGVHGVDSMFHHDAPVVATTDHPPATSAVTGGSEHPPAAVPGGAEAAPAAPAAAPEAVSSAHPTEPEGLLVGATIHRPGEGFGEMIQEFKHNFHEQLSVIDKPSPALAYVLNSNPNDLTHELLVAKDGMSLTMQPGDQLIADDNQNIWFQRVGGEPQLVYENDPTAPGGFVKHEIHGHMQADAVRPEAPIPEVARAVPSEGASIVQEDPSAALNRAQLGGSPIPETLAARTDYADGAGINTLTLPQSLDTSGLQFTEHPTEAPAAPPAQAPEAVPASAPAPTAQPIATPETAPAAHPAVAPEAAAPAPAPEAAPAPAPVPEQAPVAPVAPETVSTGPHPFASPDASPFLNENGVDLNKPQVLLNEGRWWAHGTNADDSYERAVAQSTALARAGEPSNVYFVVPDTDVTGRDTLSVRMVFTPPDGSNAQIAPYGEGLSTNAQFTMPPLPNDADYKLPPSK